MILNIQVRRPLASSSRLLTLSNAVGRHPIYVYWELIYLDLVPGAPFQDINTAISLNGADAMTKFQHMFPNMYHFRVRLIDEALR